MEPRKENGTDKARTAGCSQLVRAWNKKAWTQPAERRAETVCPVCIAAQAGGKSG